MGWFSSYTYNSRINKLNKAKNDLCDDDSSIRNYNNAISDAVQDIQRFIRRENGQICSKLEGYKEPYQYNDSNLNTARDYIQREINYQARQRDAAEQAANATDGGGGSW